ncbi:unnamed protein product, partial [Ectocarpus fasciculatus]
MPKDNFCSLSHARSIYQSTHQPQHLRKGSNNHKYRRKPRPSHASPPRRVVVFTIHHSLLPRCRRSYSHTTAASRNNATIKRRGPRKPFLLPRVTLHESPQVFFRPALPFPPCVVQAVAKVRRTTQQRLQVAAIISTATITT